MFVAGITGHFLDLEKENPRYVGPARTWRGFYVCLTANPARSKRLAGPGNALCSLAGRYLWWRDAPIRGAGGDYGSSDHSTGGWGEYWHWVPVLMVSFRWCPRSGKAVVIFLLHPLLQKSSKNTKPECMVRPVGVWLLNGGMGRFRSGIGFLYNHGHCLTLSRPAQESSATGFTHCRCIRQPGPFCPARCLPELWRRQALSAERFT